MKKILTLTLLFVCVAISSCDTLSQVAQTAGTYGLGTPSQLEMISGLKQALEQGTTKSSSQLSAVDGFFANAAIKILLPPEAQKAEKALRTLGLNSLVDNAVLSINRAAESAAREAKPIFVDAIKQMTIQDVTNILLGNQDAATNYFKRATTNALMARFQPVINSSLSKVGATKYYGNLVSQYNRIPLVTKINPDLSAYVTQKAIDGLFYEIAQEELNIRTNISARTTPLLQKVFGYAANRRTGNGY